MEVGERGGVAGKIKEIFKPTCVISEEDLRDSSETRLLHDAQGGITTGPQPKLYLKSSGKIPVGLQ